MTLQKSSIVDSSAGKGLGGGAGGGEGGSDGSEDSEKIPADKEDEGKPAEETTTNSEESPPQETQG